MSAARKETAIDPPNSIRMSKLTRREFAVKAAGTIAATAALPLLGSAKQPQSSPKVDQEAMLKDIDSKLAAPLSAEARKLTEAALTNSQQAAKDRLKFRLQDCSEPCFIYIPSEVGK